MTGLALPIDASGGSPAFSGRQHRSAMAAFSAYDGAPLAGRSGIRPMGGTAANIVTLVGSTITVATHVGTVAPAWSTLTGLYQVALTVAENATLTAQGANPRKDIVVGRVYDDSESASGLRIYRSEYIAGTPNASPVEPSVPAGAIKLATIDVPSSGGGSPAVTNNYTFTAAAGGILRVRSQAERDAISNPYDGYPVYRDDRNWVEIHDGTAWRVQGVAVCSSGTDRDNAITNPYAGQLAIVTNVGLIYRYTGSAWTTLVPAIARDVQATSGTTGSTTFTSTLTGGTAAGVAFVAPPSGVVEIINTCQVSNNATGTSICGFEVRTGAVVGSGTVFLAASDDASVLKTATDPVRASCVDAATGLTPGSSYNVRQVFRNTTGTGSFSRKNIKVIPSLG